MRTQLATGLFLTTAITLAAFQGPSSDWPMYNRDPAGTRYSPLTQINTKNASKLHLAWTYQLRSAGTGRGARGSGSEATPIVVNDVMYMPAAGRVVALNPETGREIWRYELPSGSPGNRGVSYWPGDKNNPPRIIFTAGHTMVGLNARTGKLDPGFGKEGEVNLVIPYNSPPTIYKNFLFVGANVPEINAPNLPGDTRAYDARTGAKLWEFHSVPRAGEPGNETWEQPDSWKDRTGVNNWGFQMAVNAQRDILYTTFGSPASDFYGGDRKGNDLYGNSVVALDINTGKMKWYFQAVHHDVWDFDLPPAPALLDVTIDGKKVPVLAQTGKVGYMYILNRVTGEPIFPIKETPVPKSQVPGEFLSPTQPIPVKPPPFGRMSFTLDDLVTAADTNEEHAAACRDLVNKSGGAHNEGPFTPYAWRAPGAAPVSNVIFPGPIGGVNWGGSATDPKLGYVYVFTNEYASIGWIQQEPATSKVPYQQASIYGNPFNSKFWAMKKDENGLTLGAQSWPCQKPPWGRSHCSQYRHGRIRLADSPRRDGRTPRRQEEHRPHRFRRTHRHCRRRLIHRRHQRQALPCFRFQDRKTALGGQTRLQRHRRPHHLHEQEPSPIRRDHGSQRRRRCHRSRPSRWRIADGLHTAVRRATHSTDKMSL